MKHKPGMKTNVVLLDTVDYGNGFASVFPYPQVTLYLTDWSTNLNPSKYDLWLKFLFIHEYTHILHLDITEGYARLTNFFFGRVLFPNAVEPWFITEGLATYSETKNHQWGRGDDPRWDMLMRMDVLEDNVKSIDQAAVNSVLWPDGHLRYIYGVEFLEYLAETYGEERLISLAHVYGDFLFSYGIDGAFVYLYRKNLRMLWNEWLEHLVDKYDKQKQALGQLTEPGLVTHSGYYNLKPKWAKDSNRIFFQQRNADDYPSIRVIDVRNQKENKVFEGWVSGNNLSLDPSGRKLLFTKMDTHKNYYSFNDLYLYDLQNRRLQRLSEGLRSDDADLSPDGSKIIFVRNELGTKALMQMEMGDQGAYWLGTWEADVQYFSPRFSPDGSKIVVAKWIPGGKQKMYLVDPSTGEQDRLTAEDNLASEANPCFSGDGKYIFFDSDRSGIVNLYAFHLENKQLFKITNVLGGAMMPDASPDGKKLAYVSYSSQGYDIAVLELEPSAWKEIVMEPETKRLGSIEKKIRNREVHSQVPSRNYEIHDYQPLPTLRPHFWLPLDTLNENGYQTYIYTTGSDVLNKHMYFLAYNYDWEGEKAQYGLTYVNNQFLPQVVCQMLDNSVAYSWENSTLWMREKYGLFSISLYDNRVFSEWDRQVVSIGYEHTNIDNIGSIESFSTQPSLGNVNGLFVAWRYLNARQYAKSISYEDGMDLSVTVTLNSADLGSDYSYTNYSVSGSSYFPALVKHHVFAPTLSGFYSQGEQLNQSNFTWRYLPLRGYSSTNMRGNKGVSLQNEYRFPISYPETGLYYGTTFFDKIWADVFYDIGGATSEAVSNLRFKASYGFELNFDTSFGWDYLALTLKLGYVKGLDVGGEEKFYFTIGM